MKIERMHFTDSAIMNAVNPVTINLIGAGGSGSHLIEALGRIHFALVATGKAGIHLTVFDPDGIERPNLARGNFNENYLGINKAVAMINYINRKCGTNWKAVPDSFMPKSLDFIPANRKANITISCVDTLAVRLEIEQVLVRLSAEKGSANHRDRPVYHIDFGNAKNTGQMVLSTVGKVKQPVSEKFETVDFLPPVSVFFGEQVSEAGLEDDDPSCSVFDALSKQGLFINSALANYGGKFIYDLLDEGMTDCRGFYMNLEIFRAAPIGL